MPLEPSEIASGANWLSEPVATAVCSVVGDQVLPSIANVGGGNVIIAWADSRTPDEDLYAQKLNGLGTAQWLTGGLPICRASGGQASPKLVADGAGGAIAAWEDGRSGTAKIYAQRLDGNGQPLWTLDGIPLCTASGGQAQPAIVPDGSGGAIVAWVDHRGTSGDLYAQRVDSNGNLLWSSDGVPLCRAAGDQLYMALASDGQSGALAAWTDDRAGNDDIYANRVVAAGGTVDVPIAEGGRLRLAFASSNPARGEVRMWLELPVASTVAVDVSDALGRQVRALGTGTPLGSGPHVITWDGTDQAGAPVSAGIYFVRVRAGSSTLVGRVVELR